MTDVTRLETKFHQLLQEQIRSEFGASQQYIAVAVYFDGEDLPQLAKHFYAQAVEERNHAMMLVKYLLDRDIDVEIPGVDPVRNSFASPTEALKLALTQERVVTEQISRLAPDKSAPIVLYCRSGRRSGLAQDALQALGYQQVINAGGIDSLKAAQQAKSPEAACTQNC